MPDSLDADTMDFSLYPQLSAARSEVSRTFWKAAQRKVPQLVDVLRWLRTMSGGKP
jgi:hypothetical protein